MTSSINLKPSRLLLSQAQLSPRSLSGNREGVREVFAFLPFVHRRSVFVSLQQSLRLCLCLPLDPRCPLRLRLPTIGTPDVRCGAQVPREGSQDLPTP